jgi:hypothetical protein
MLTSYILTGREISRPPKVHRAEGADAPQWDERQRAEG